MSSRLSESSHLFTCFNCSKVQDSLWVVSYVVDLSSVDECLCCVTCLARNFKDPNFSQEHRITLRCGGDGCNLQIDTWTKSSELVVSLIKNHTDNCPFRPNFCPRGCGVVCRRQDIVSHIETSCTRKETQEERDSLKMEEIEQRLIIPKTKTRYSQVSTVPIRQVSAPRPSLAGPMDAASPEALRREALSISKRTSEVPVVQRSYSLNAQRNSVTDETLEQLEQARAALLLQTLEDPDGRVSYLPDIVAQKFSSDDVDLRERVEKLEDLLATTRAQLEKAFKENRDLRSMLNTETKLRDLNVSKLRDEVDILRSLVYRPTRTLPRH